MKNFKSILGFLSLLIFVTSCQEKPKENTTSEEENTPPTADIKAPEQLLGIKEADILYRNYTNRRVQNIIAVETQETGDKDFNPTRFVDFDYNTLKNYISFIEQEANKSGTSIDSLRIYYGNYGNYKKPNERHNTVFLLPVGKVSGESGGFFINDNGKAELIRTYINKSKNEKSEASIVPSNLNPVNGGSSLILNYGHCCPPRNGDFNW